MFNQRNIIAAVVGGVLGTFANGVVVWLLVGAPLLQMLFGPGRLIVAILVALLLIPIYARMTGAAAHAAAVAALAIIPTILAKTVFAAGAGWGLVLGVNLVYAVVAVAVYVAMRRRV